MHFRPSKMGEDEEAAPRDGNECGKSNNRMGGICALCLAVVTLPEGGKNAGEYKISFFGKAEMEQEKEQWIPNGSLYLLQQWLLFLVRGSYCMSRSRRWRVFPDGDESSGCGCVCPVPLRLFC